MQAAAPLACARCRAPLPAQARFCPSCGGRIETAPGRRSPAIEPERILFKEAAIAYRGWFDGLRMSIPFAGVPGYLALTSQRLVFVRGLVRGRFDTLDQMSAALARRGGHSFLLRDIREAATDSQFGAAIGSGEARLAVRASGPSGIETHTFTVSSLAATYLGMDAWVLIIDEARREVGPLSSA